MGHIIGGKIPSCVYTYTNVINATASSFTFNSVPVSTESAKRYVVVGALTQGSIQTGCKINGAAATSVSSFGPNFYILSVPTGTTATITITMSASVASIITIAVWALYDITSATPYASSTSVANPAVLDLNIPNRGVVIAESFSGVNGASFTWTGPLVDFSQTSSINNLTRSGAHQAVTAAGTPMTVRCAYSAAASPRAVALSWR